MNNVLAGSMTNRDVHPGIRPSLSGIVRRNDGYPVLIGCAVLFAAIPVWVFGNSPAAILTLCGLLLILCAWYVITDIRTFRGLTFTSMFVASTWFVFFGRASYIAFTADFSLMEAFGLQSSYEPVVNAMGYVVFTTVAFIWGACMLRRKAAIAFTQRSVFEHWGKIKVNLSLIFIYAQVGISSLLSPIAFASDRNVIFTVSSSAYIYMLPTIVHGFDLYWFVHALTQWWNRRDPIRFLLLVITVALTVYHAFLLSNFTLFRSYYLIGLFCCVISSFLIIFRKIPIVVFLLLVGVYPFFKFLGIDRTLNSRELLQDVIMKPEKAYTSDGLIAAFGSGTDLNMIDTLAASLSWNHAYRPYVLSFPYVLVHWIPRAWWPGKPEQGILGDMGYLYLAQLGVSAPLSPGLIGNLNDDGGPVYMIITMFFMGLFMAAWEMWVFRIKSYDLYIAVYATLILTSLIFVRFLPYQAFYLFVTFFLPCWACDKFIHAEVKTGKRN